MISQAAQLEIELLRVIDREINRLKDQLALNNFEDIGPFKYIMGQIAALKNMEDLIEEAKEHSSQRNR
jgi:hypothetical protein